MLLVNRARDPRHVSRAHHRHHPIPFRFPDPLRQVDVALVDDRFLHGWKRLGELRQDIFQPVLPLEVRPPASLSTSGSVTALVRSREISFSLFQ